MNYGKKMIRAMMNGTPWNMATATYSYTRSCGFSRIYALKGAIEIWWQYMRRERK